MRAHQRANLIFEVLQKHYKTDTKYKKVWEKLSFSLFHSYVSRQEVIVE